jgi:hypothetical protein
MKESLMAVKDNHYFKGNIRSFDPEAFGFCYCKVKTPKYLEHPILQKYIHIQTNNGLK